MNKRTFLIGFRLFFGLLTLIAIGVQLSIHIANGFNVVNFFSYFTNLSNIFASVVLLLAALMLMRSQKPSPSQELVRATATVAMIIVGVVYNVLLANEDLGSLLPWINNVLHNVMPMAMLFDWAFQPPLSDLTFKRLLPSLIYPLAFLAYSLVRGPIVGWYPYPFLDAASIGYAAVAAYCVAIFGAFLLVGWLLMVLQDNMGRNVS